MYIYFSKNAGKASVCDDFKRKEGKINLTSCKYFHTYLIQFILLLKMLYIIISIYIYIYI